MGTLIIEGSVREGRLVVNKAGLTGLYDVEPSLIDVGTAVFQSGFSAWPMVINYLGFKLESTHRPNRGCGLVPSVSHWLLSMGSRLLNRST